jgi:uncharacterized protein YndB with AHSA1/START domain
MRRILLYAGLILVLIVVVVVGVGYALPVKHEAWRNSTSRRPPAEVFAAITDYAKYPEWRAGVTRVEVEGAPGAGQIVREHSSDGVIPYKVETFQPPARLVTRVLDSDQPFGGTWTFELTPSDSGTDIVLTENGEIYNAVFRFMARYVFGYHATIDQYLEDLRKKLGDPTPAQLPR